MRLTSMFLPALFSPLLVGRPVFAQALEVSRSPRELGKAVLRELSVGEGKISFRVDSNGCTDAGSFEVRIIREQGITEEAPHYRLTIVRVRIGSILRESLNSRRMNVELTDRASGTPLEIVLFMVWVILLIHGRE